MDRTNSVNTTHGKRMKKGPLGIEREKTLYRGFAEEAPDSYCIVQTRKKYTTMGPWSSSFVMFTDSAHRLSFFCVLIVESCSYSLLLQPHFAST